MATSTDIRASAPAETLDWLSSAENPAVAVLTRRELIGEADSAKLRALWAKRNEYAPVARILDEFPQLVAERTKGYQKYHGLLWQAHFLGEMWADGSDPRAQVVADQVFGMQLDDGAWSTNDKPAGSIPCLTANVGRALARMGWARDARIVRALTRVADDMAEAGYLKCAGGGDVYTLSGYCHMLAPKLLLFLGEVPEDLWPESAKAMHDECVCVMRAREVYVCLAEGARFYFDAVYKHKLVEIPALRDQWIAEHGPVTYAEKPGWKRFGYPLSYNSDALESLAALAAVGEPMRDEYSAAIELVRTTADPQMRWAMRNTFNDKTVAKIEKKGQPSRWLTLRALRVLKHFGALGAEAGAA